MSFELSQLFSETSYAASKRGPPLVADEKSVPAKSRCPSHPATRRFLGIAACSQKTLPGHHPPHRPQSLIFILIFIFIFFFSFFFFLLLQTACMHIFATTTLTLYATIYLDSIRVFNKHLEGEKLKEKLQKHRVIPGKWQKSKITCTFNWNKPFHPTLLCFMARWYGLVSASPSLCL